MGGWSEISNEFLKYLNKSSKVDKKELEKMSANSAVVKYENEFSKWLKNQKGISEKDLQKNAIDLDNEDDENFFDEVFSGYISDLDKDDSVYKAIDKNSDGKISESEKKEFLSSAKNLDNDDSNITIKDISLAQKNINSGKGIQNVSAQNTASTPQQADAADSGVQVQQADIDTQGEEVEVTKDVNINVSTPQEIDEALETVRLNKGQCNAILDQVNEQMEDIESKYQESAQDLDEYASIVAQSDENVKTHQEALNSSKQQNDEGISTLNALVSQKDGISSSLSAVNAQIAQYGDEAPQELLSQKETLENQLQETIDKIRTQEQLNETYSSNLADAQMNLTQAVFDSEDADKEYKKKVVETARRASNLTLFNTVKQNAQAELSVAESQEEVLKSKQVQQGNSEEK